MNSLALTKTKMLSAMQIVPARPSRAAMSRIWNFSMALEIPKVRHHHRYCSNKACIMVILEDSSSSGMWRKPSCTSKSEKHFLWRSLCSRSLKGWHLIKWMEHCFIYYVAGIKADSDFPGCFPDYFIQAPWRRFVNFFYDACVLILVKATLFYRWFCYWNVMDGHLDGGDSRFNSKVHRWTKTAKALRFCSVFCQDALFLKLASQG